MIQLAKRENTHTELHSLVGKMVEYLEQDQIQAFKEAFDSFDSNDNGKVSSHSLQVRNTGVK